MVGSIWVSPTRGEAGIWGQEGLFCLDTPSKREQVGSAVVTEAGKTSGL